MRRLENARRLRRREGEGRRRDNCDKMEVKVSRKEVVKRRKKWNVRQLVSEGEGKEGKKQM